MGQWTIDKFCFISLLTQTWTNKFVGVASILRLELTVQRKTTVSLARFYESYSPEPLASQVALKIICSLPSLVSFFPLSPVLTNKWQKSLRASGGLEEGHPARMGQNHNKHPLDLRHSTWHTVIPHISLHFRLCSYVSIIKPLWNQVNHNVSASFCL